MTFLNLEDKACSSSLKLLGDYWTLRVLDALSLGEMHFCELQRRVDNLNPVTLTGRLKKLEKAKLIKRQAVAKTKVSYSLSKMGYEILPILDAINTFSRKTSKPAN